MVRPDCPADVGRRVLRAVIALAARPDDGAGDVGVPSATAAYDEHACSKLSLMQRYRQSRASVAVVVAYNRNIANAGEPIGNRNLGPSTGGACGSPGVLPLEKF